MNYLLWQVLLIILLQNNILCENLEPSSIEKSNTTTNSEDSTTFIVYPEITEEEHVTPSFLSSSETQEAIKKILESNQNLDELRNEKGKLILSLLPQKCRDQIIKDKLLNADAESKNISVEEKDNYGELIKSNLSLFYKKLKPEPNSTTTVSNPTPKPSTEPLIVVSKYYEDVPQIEIHPSPTTATPSAYPLLSTLQNYANQWRYKWLQNPLFVDPTTAQSQYDIASQNVPSTYFPTSYLAHPSYYEKNVNPSSLHHADNTDLDNVNLPQHFNNNYLSQKPNNLLEKFKYTVANNFPLIQPILGETATQAPNLTQNIYTYRNNPFLLTHQQFHNGHYRIPQQSYINNIHYTKFNRSTSFVPVLPIKPTTTSTTTTTTTTVMPSTTENSKPEQIFDHRLKFILPVKLPKSNPTEVQKYPWEFDPFAYYPPSFRPKNINVPLPYKPVYHMIRTLTIPNGNEYNESNNKR